MQNGAEKPSLKYHRFKTKYHGTDQKILGERATNELKMLIICKRCLIIRNLTLKCLQRE